MIVSRFINSSVCATNIQTEAKMENAIYISIIIVYTWERIHWINHFYSRSA